MFRAGPPVNRLIFSVTFNVGSSPAFVADRQETDKIRIIDAPTEQVQQAFIEVVHVSPRLSRSC